MKRSIFILLSLFGSTVFAQNYPIVDTDQSQNYDTLTTITTPSPGNAFYGQDAVYQGNQASYTDNGDGTVTDNVTGLMWAKSTDIDLDATIEYEDKISYDSAVTLASSFSLAGYNDWRLPTIKELYSLIMFSGEDPSGYSGTSTTGITPFINTNYFDFAYGFQAEGERIIDAQYVSSTEYVGVGGGQGNADLVFGVNFADGRIKGYEQDAMPGQTEPKKFSVLYVRGATTYGVNDFQNNGDGTITDQASGLMWSKDDNGSAISWAAALDYAEASTLAGHSDWRLPNAKELQSIVDYTRSPQTSSSAAIDPMFNASTITDEGGGTNYAFYWTGTTHACYSCPDPGMSAVYLCFGEALGWMEMPPSSGNYSLNDVHGAGAQRSEFKTGDPGDYPYGHGPQGDVVRIFHYVRLVRDAGGAQGINDPMEKLDLELFPNPASDELSLRFGEVLPKASTITFYNSLGQEVFSFVPGAARTFRVDVSGFASDLYVVKIATGTAVHTVKFLKK